MRFVVLGNLLGIGLALIGLAVFGLGWLAAAAIWLLSGPAGAALALLSAQQRPARDEVPVDVAAQRRIA